MTRTLAKICPYLKASRRLGISWWIILKQSLQQLDMESRFASVILLVETEVSFCSRTVNFREVREVATGDIENRLADIGVIVEW